MSATSPVSTPGDVSDPVGDRLVTVCALDDIDPEGAVTALVGGRAVAVFRTLAGTVHALDNYDPFSHASVLARGIVGTVGSAEGTVDVVASPMHKQRFDLRTGRCLDDDAVAVPVYPVRVEHGVVVVAERPVDMTGQAGNQAVGQADRAASAGEEPQE